MAHKKFLQVPAAAARKGLPFSYAVEVDGKIILTGGEVQRAVKTGDNEITVTIRHYKTGEIHTNALAPDRVAYIHMVALVNKGISGSLTLWPTGPQYGDAKFAALAQREAFKGLPVGTEF